MSTASKATKTPGLRMAVATLLTRCGVSRLDALAATSSLGDSQLATLFALRGERAKFAASLNPQTVPGLTNVARELRDYVDALDAENDARRRQTPPVPPVRVSPILVDIEPKVAGAVEAEIAKPGTDDVPLEWTDAFLGSVVEAALA